MPKELLRIDFRVTESTSNEQLWKPNREMPARVAGDGLVTLSATSQEYYATSLNLEPPGAAILQQTCNKQDTIGEGWTETDSEPECLVELCWWPMPRDGWCPMVFIDD